MVNLEYILKVVRELEIYFIKKSNFKFDGSAYSLILFIPAIRYGGKYKYNLILSAVKLDNYPRKEIISEMFAWLKGNLSQEEFEKIESIVIANTNSSFVHNLNFMIPVKVGIKELDNISVGGVSIDYGILIYSNLLKKLKPNCAISVELKDGRTINMGIDTIDENLNISFYTGKGLRELFPQTPNIDEEEKAKKLKKKEKKFLKEHSYYDNINLSEILKIKESSILSTHNV